MARLVCGRRASNGVIDDDEQVVTDYDPEAELPSDSDLANGDDSENDRLATEHYVDVGKRSLGSQDPPSLGPKYRGSVVKRVTMDNDSSGLSDNDSVDGDTDIDLEGESESDVPHGAYDDRDSESSSSSSSTLRDSSVDDSSDSEDNNTVRQRTCKQVDGSDNSLKSTTRAFGEGLKSSISRLAEAARKEATQGFALQQQRQTFDSILGLRVRLQKALVAANSLGLANTTESQDTAYETAEAAAIALLDRCEMLRTRMLPEVASKKRKRDMHDNMCSTDINGHLLEIEERSAAQRRQILEKWSSKANRSFVGQASTNKQLSIQKSLVEALDDQVATPDRLVKKTRVPRSCAPIQSASKEVEDHDIYDDADFYQVLLKELLDQRMADPLAGRGNVTTVVYAAQKDAKHRRVVDTKASKGRKMRFNVHDKLVNFMTRDDTRNWDKNGINLLFGGLFGKKMELDEDSGDASADEIDNLLGEAPSALPLFKT